MTLIEVDNLNVSMSSADGSEVHAARDVSFRIDTGQQLALVGESGCGKSTTLMSLMGLLPPTATVSGRVIVDGVDVFRAPEAKLAALRWRTVSMIFQASSNPLNPVRTLGHQLRSVLEFHRMQGDDIRARVLELIDMVRLPSGSEQLYPHQLSGGMRQRAVIALALSCNPKILLADEPTTALDPLIQAEILDLMLGLCERLGLALVLVTHDLPLVRRITGRAAVMHAGAIVETGEAKVLMRNPQHPYLKRLIAAIPQVEGVEA
jgi:ABC-type glutathione transport system ATPase component